MTPSKDSSESFFKSAPNDFFNSSPDAMKHMIVYDLTTRFIPKIVGHVTKFIGGHFQNRAKRMCEDVLRRKNLLSKKPRKGSVVIERNYKTSGEHNDMFDAVLSLASDLPEAKQVKRTAKGIFFVETRDEIPLNADILFAKLNVVELEGEIEKMSIDVFSYTQDIVQIRDYLVRLEEDYLKKKKNQLGRQIFYFDEMFVALPMIPSLPGSKDCGPVPDLSKAPSTLTFTMFPLNTNKSLKNIYGASVKQAKSRIDFFLNNPGWYRDKGIPYTLGILLHGEPGCGKTSFIKGLAHDTNRHVVNLKLRRETTLNQINSLFYSSRMNVLREGSSTNHDIPTDKRIIVMEDIDCLSSIVLDRKSYASEREEDALTKQQLNLSVLLNILDGVLETPGRIVIMTSNEPRKLDPALVRPGRIDISIEFKKCSAEDILDMLSGLCDYVVNEKDRAVTLQELDDGKWTPAEVAKVIFENIGRPRDALEKFKRPLEVVPAPLSTLTTPLTTLSTPLSTLATSTPLTNLTTLTTPLSNRYEKVLTPLPILFDETLSNELTLSNEPISIPFNQNTRRNVMDPLICEIKPFDDIASSLFHLDSIVDYGPFDPLGLEGRV